MILHMSYEERDAWLPGLEPAPGEIQAETAVVEPESQAVEPDPNQFELDIR